MNILLTISGSNISPRMDKTREILIFSAKDGKLITPPRAILLDRSSAEDLCSFIIKEEIDCVVCGGIEDKHYKYLTWKKTKVIDSIIGPYKKAMDLLLKNKLSNNTILPGARNY